MFRKLEKNQKITAWIAGIVTIVIISASILHYYKSSSILKAEVIENLKSKVDYFNEKGTSFFEGREVLLETEARYAEKLLSESSAGEVGIIRRLAFQYEDIRRDFGIWDIYVGYPNGLAESGSGWNSLEHGWKSYDRPWYIVAEQNPGQIAYTSAYLDIDTETPIITLAKMIQNSNTKAVMAIDISLMQLHSILQEKLGRNGYPFIIDKSGRFILHPQFSLKKQMEDSDTIYNVADGKMQDLGINLLKQDSAVYEATFDGHKKLYFSKKMGNTDLYLVAGADRSETVKQLTLMLIHCILICVIALLSFLLMLFVLNQKNTKNAMKEGNYS